MNDLWLLTGDMLSSTYPTGFSSTRLGLYALRFLTVHFLLAYLVQHLWHIHLPRISMPPNGSESLPHLSHVLSFCIRDIAVSVVSRNEFVEGSRGGLEFIEYLWVGCCNPVQELHELLVDLLQLSIANLVAVNTHLNVVEVSVDIVKRFLQQAQIHSNWRNWIFD